jgi:hypothetical protein
VASILSGLVVIVAVPLATLVAVQVSLVPAVGPGTMTACSQPVVESAPCTDQWTTT